MRRSTRPRISSLSAFSIVRNETRLRRGGGPPSGTASAHRESPALTPPSAVQCRPGRRVTRFRYPPASRGEVAELVESAPLLRVYRLIPYRGFESLPLRHPGSGCRDFPLGSEDGSGKAREFAGCWRLRSFDSEPETGLFRGDSSRFARLSLWGISVVRIGCLRSFSRFRKVLIAAFDHCSLVRRDLRHLRFASLLRTRPAYFLEDSLEGPSLLSVSKLLVHDYQSLENCLAPRKHPIEFK